MNESNPILERDLAIMAQMAHEMAGYLLSDVPTWSLSVADMPPLTIGGYLMRQQRLSTLHEQLTPDQQQQFERAIQVFESALVERIVRYETRAHQELRSRLREWSRYLRDATSVALTHADYYATVVDTRVVITATVEGLSTPPYEIDPRLCEQIDQLDQHLRRRWEEGPFIWDAIWLRAYPPERYWWLYGHPKAD